MNRRLFGLALAIFLVGGARHAAGAAEAVTAFVAASTGDAVKRIAAVFTDTTGIAVKLSPGGSNALANQILEGAGADVFLSASREWADKIRQEGQALEVRPLLSNDLVLVVPQDNPAKIAGPQDLLGAKLTHLALAGEKVPAGVYAEQALKAEKLYDELNRQKKIVRGQDVRAALAFVERGEAEAGVVYWTDALSCNAVKVAFNFDPEDYDKIVYPLVLLKHAEGNPAARRLFDFFSSEPARHIFEDRGFRLLK